MLCSNIYFYTNLEKIIIVIHVENCYLPIVSYTFYKTEKLNLVKIIIL